jgi:hypothetical protein
MLRLRKLIYGCHDQRIPHVPGTCRQKVLVKKVAMRFHKKCQKHNDRSGITLTERIHLPDRRKALDQFGDKFLPRKTVPGNCLYCFKSRLQIPVYHFIVGIPHTAATKKPFRFFNIDFAVFSGPTINIAKEKAVNET